MQNNFQDGKREHLWVGSRWRCNRRRVDSEEYYKGKLSKVEADWEFLKVRQYRENAGIAFVSFRDKNCVIDAIDEIEIYKVKL
jgi:transcription elongation factor